jgi:toxin ParE1/3/4
MRVIWSPLSLRQLAELRAHIERDNAAAAADQVVRVTAAVERLVVFPRLGRAGQREGTRELVVGGTPWIVIYRPGPRALFVLQVLHGRRDRSRLY